MVKPSVFGDVKGVMLDDTFADRNEVRLAGLHRHNQHGISGNYNEGADAIVVSGGYRDDLDLGDRIIYTGHGGQKGGRQVTDQKLEAGNRALALSEEAGYPVRVIRRLKGDPRQRQLMRYVYSGLFVVSEHWRERSVDGPWIWRFTLDQLDESESMTWGGDAALPLGNDHPERARSVVQRIVRSSAVTTAVKRLHQNRCQFCGIQLATETGFYAEGAHVRALGRPHNGRDQPSNVLCLCPNDHVLFDKGALYLADGVVYRAADGSVVGPLRTVTGHVIDEECARYHRTCFARVD